MRYTQFLSGITSEQLKDFFEFWPNPPKPETHLKILHGSQHVWLALDDDGASERVIGFVTAITDQVFYAYIPLLEVIPSYRKRGVGSELMRRMMETLENMYAIDLCCDPDKQAFYGQVGMELGGAAMLVRNYARQSGE